MPEAEGDELIVTLPFLIKLKEMASAGGFLQQYYMAHHDISHGTFCTDDMYCNFLDMDDKQIQSGMFAAIPADIPLPDDLCFSINLRVWLAPFDFGVRQQVKVMFCPSDIYQGFRQVRVVIHREAGEHKAWENLNKTFLNALRKQLLAWRSLDEEAIEKYAEDLATHMNTKRHDDDKGGTA
jgi:hypothetical protein